VNEQAIKDWILEHLIEVGLLEAADDCFFYYKPLNTEEFDQKMPFATLVTKDDYDQVSNLSRAGVFRLNIGVRPETYRAMFGQQPPFRTDGVIDLDHDFTALDQIMPNPVYAAMSWICVLNPGAETFAQLEPLLIEAHGMAKRRAAHH
jgi:hypothetical protein